MSSSSSSLAKSLDLTSSWIRQLSPETAENLAKSRKVAGLSSTDSNQTKRPVYNGHYVLVQPTPLPNPRLLLVSKPVALRLLGLTEQQMESDDFLQLVSGNGQTESWATPYALSIMGTRYTHNCPYGTGDGYGDGRAISVAEIHGHELQLKGAGQTPFHRGADGRAVLRSSIREFLASEAMHHLGVATTRALSLVVSDKESAQRPWYSDDAVLQTPSLDDPRLAKYAPEQRKEILQQVRHQKADPNIMVTEQVAITCRVATSFMRVGHIDLFARRAERASLETADETSSRWNTDTLEWKELEQIIWHACYREFRSTAYDPYRESNDIAQAATVLLQSSATQLAAMVAGWIRVGFAQGNFNADNCLVGGKTMDYGPFGWLEEYNPLFAKWTGSGDHFGFLNQPSAGYANYQVLVESVVPVICAARGIEDPDDTIKEFLKPATIKFQTAVDEMFRVKLGFEKEQDVGDNVWEELEPLIRKSRTDWTVFFRQLTHVVRDFADPESSDYEGMLHVLISDEASREGSSPFYEPLDKTLRSQWLSWIETWRNALVACGSLDACHERMRLANPKYVLREWMLVEAYTSASKGEEAELFYLYDLIQRPYGEGSADEEKRYYRRAPDVALTTGGTAFMS